MEKVTICRALRYDPENLPEDFEDQIKKAFVEYTEETSHNYTFCDKLAFIDRCIECIAKTQNEHGRASDILENRIHYEWRENGVLISEDDLFSIDQMEDMYRHGKNDARLYQDYGFLHGSLERDAIQKMMIRIIKVVICFDWGDEDAT